MPTFSMPSTVLAVVLPAGAGAPATIPSSEFALRCRMEFDDGAGDNAAEWEQIAREALTNAEIDGVAAYLRSTGQASA